MSRTKKVKIAGKFGARYGSTVREKYGVVATKQAKKQQCPYCKKFKVKKTSKGVWHCKSCNKRFTARSYYLNS